MNSAKRNAGRGALRFTAPAILWFVFIMVLLSLPGSSFPAVRIWQPDKIAHVLLFGMQHVLLWLALELPIPRRIAAMSPLWAAAAFTTAFGVLSEVYQEVATTRLMDPYDMLANALGVALAVVLILLVGRSRLLTAMSRLFRVG
jgi:VanZ family protein